jgi:hypothetical protein
MNTQDPQIHEREGGYVVIENGVILSRVFATRHDAEGWARLHDKIEVLRLTREELDRCHE